MGEFIILMNTTTIMNKVLDFLNKLQVNNNREWFLEHKDEYLEALAIFDTFIEQLIIGIQSFDTSIKHLSVKDCTFRIYRDARFSKDKTPYKTHMGAFISPTGKKGPYSGYYFHVEATNAAYIGSNILSTGIYRPLPNVLKSIREEVMLNGEQFLSCAYEATGFKLNSDNMLKRVPTGFPADSKFAEYFKFKDYFLSKSFDNSFLLSEDLLENTIKEFKKTLPFHNLLNKAASYALEESNF